METRLRLTIFTVVSIRSEIAATPQMLMNVPDSVGGVVRICFQAKIPIPASQGNSGKWIFGFLGIRNL